MLVFLLPTLWMWNNITIKFTSAAINSIRTGQIGNNLIELETSDYSNGLSKGNRVKEIKKEIKKDLKLSVNWIMGMANGNESTSPAPPPPNQFKADLI